MAFTGQHTQEARQRISESNRRNWDDPAVRAAHGLKTSAGMKAALANPEVRAKISAANTRAWAKRRGYAIPPDFRKLYRKLWRNFGMQEAVRMLKEHARAREGTGI